MPTVLFVYGFRFFFYAADGNEPPLFMFKEEEVTERFGFLRYLESTNWKDSRQRSNG